MPISSLINNSFKRNSINFFTELNTNNLTNYDINPGFLYYNNYLPCDF